MKENNFLRILIYINQTFLFLSNCFKHKQK